MARCVIRFDLRAPSFGAPAVDLYRAAIEMSAWADRLDFEARHRQARGEIAGLRCRTQPFAQPADTDAHLRASRCNQPNWRRKRRSFSKYRRMSLTP